jgi:hypothetical protein
MDPISAKTHELISKTADIATQTAQDAKKSQQSPHGQAFNDILNEKMNPLENIDIKTGAVPKINKTAEPSGSHLDSSRIVGSLKNLVKKLNDSQSNLDRMISHAMSETAYSPQDLLMMQMTMLKYSQQIELAAKIVEQVVGGIKTTMQTQV